MSKKKLILSLLKYSFLAFLFCILVILFAFVYYTRDLPRPEVFTERELTQSTKIYDRTGEILLYDIYGEEKRKYVSFEEIPDHLKHAVLAAEDARFYEHRGLDIKGVLRAFWKNIQLRKLAEGGSTITQQLVRSSFLTSERTFERKIKELSITLEIEKRYPKEQILEWYLNQIPLGSNTYGVGSASETYFDKPVSEISIAESAILASLIKGPSYFSPYGPNIEDLFHRKNYILQRMKDLEYISEDKFEESIKEEISFIKSLSPIRAPHFTLSVKNYLERKYGEVFLKERGLKVYTTLDWEYQQIAEKLVNQEAEKNKERYNAHNASLVALDPHTGEVLSLVGSRDYFEDSYPEGCLTDPEQTCLFNPYFNVATSGNRQPGSAFKPFIYAAALQKGYTPDTVLWDVKTEFNLNCSPDATDEKDRYGLDCYHPRNYDGFYRGPVSLRDSLAQSLNLPSVKLLHLVGLKNSLEMAETLGISTFTDPSRYGLSLVLGGGEVKLLEMTSAYGIFATEGLKTNPINILRIEDAQGNIIEENKRTPRRVLSVQITKIINDLLSDNEARSPMFGSNSLLHFKDRDVAAKTGTTDEFKDAWVFGYTPDISVGVWTGNNDNTPMRKEPAINIGGGLWRSFMNEILDFYPKREFKKPDYEKTGKPILDGKIDEEDPQVILYHVNKDDPLGSPPQNPKENPVYIFWQRGLENWLE